MNTIRSRSISSLGVAGFLFVFLSLATSILAQQIKVMQWNVEGNNGHGLGRLSNNTNAQTKADARIINYNQPDILLFNEIDASNQTAAVAEAALIDWITNNVPYLGTQPGVTFFVKASTTSDGFIRNAVVSRFPIFAQGTYTSANMVRGLHAFRVQLEGTNVLQIFHAHFKCCNATGDCGERQTNAVFASNTIRAWAATNSLPYIFAGDWNEDEANPQCSFFNGYRPITMVRTNGNLVEFVPTDLNGGSKTESTPSPNVRFDYCLAGSNRLSAVSGYVFNSVVWAQNGLYTNASLQNLAGDSTTASDHCSVFVNYSFPVGPTNFSVAPTNVFTSSGNQLGPFGPSSQTYTLTNTDTIPLFWSVTKTSSWLTISTLATNLTLGAGQSTNVTAFITNSAASSLSAGIYTDAINFSNTATGVSFSRSVSLTVTALPPPVANFTGSPTNGAEPLLVTFTDTSTGNITNRFWDFGDSNSTNILTNSVSHTYTAGTYTVTLVITGLGGVNTNTRPIYLSVLPASAITVVAADLQDQFGNLMPTSGVAALVVDTGTNGFVDLQSTFPLNLGATWGIDDRVVGLWDLADSFNDFWGQPGGLFDQTVVVYTNGIARSQKLRLYWFPSLTLASNTVGVTYYGKYTDTNSPPLNGSAPWSMPASGSTVDLNFYTQSEGGSNPDAVGRATNLTTVSLIANFTGSPTSGLAPLAVTFTDNSTGTITNQFWDFGDSNTTNVTTNSVVHTYAAGTYTVMLVVSGPDGVNSNTRSNYITALTAFESWQIQYFGSTSYPAAASDADPDGDGQNNLAEFLSGTDPTNSLSGLRITAVTKEGNDVRLTWRTANGKTNAVQASAGAFYTTNFADIGTPITILGSGDPITNYLDIGAATNAPGRYYRIRLVQ